MPHPYQFISFTNPSLLTIPSKIPLKPPFSQGRKLITFSDELFAFHISPLLLTSATGLVGQNEILSHAQNK
jgi:hypothetical protein